MTSTHSILPVSRRLVLALVAFAIALAAVPQAANAAAFGVNRLRETNATGAENYLYTDGGVVFGQSTVDAASYYRFSVLDAGGTVRSSSSCIQSLLKGSATYRYAIQPTDPVTSANGWRFRIEEWTNALCGGAAAKTSSLYFDIARASSFADAGLTIPRGTFGAGSSAYVTVAGAGRVKTTAANTAQSDWETTWVRPSGSTACANTLGTDRPDADAGGSLPSGSYLKYRPNAAAPSAAWNLESNFETKPCAAFTPADDGDWSVRLLKDATHFVTLKAFHVDATPPDTTITSRPAGGTPFTSADFGFAASQLDATFECKLDGGGWTACSSPSHYTGLLDGSHTFQVRAMDPAGNVDATPASVTWTVDTTLPAVSLTSPADATATTDTTPDFAGGAGTVVGDSSTVTVKILREVAGAPDELVQTLTTTRSGGSWAVTPSVPLADGTYKAHAEQADPTGTAFSAEHSFRVDTTAPAPSVLEPRIDSVTSDTTPQLWGTGTSDAGDDTQVTVKLWSGSVASGLPVQTATATVGSDGEWLLDASPALADGIYTIRAEQSDNAGNLGVSRTHVFSVDSTAPDTSISAGPSASTASTAASFRFTSDEAGAGFECLIDDGDWGPCSSPKAYAGLAGGAHTFMVRAIDAAGNADASPAASTWTVDTTLPDVALVNPADGSTTNDTTPTFDGSAGTLTGDSSTVTVRVYRPVAGAPDELVQSQVTTRGADGAWSVPANPSLPEGDYIVRAEQLDDASNAGTSAAHSFRVDTSAPNTFFTLTPPAATGTTSADFHFDSSEAGATFECRLDAGAWMACSSPEVRSGLTAGAHTFRVRATDAAGNTDATPATTTWTVDATLPALTLEAPSDGARTNDASPSFSGHAGIAPGDSGTVTVKVYRPVAGAPDTLVETTSTTRSPVDGAWSVAASPDLDDGAYRAYAQQAGAHGTAVSSATSFSVDTTPPHTVISNGPQGTTVLTSASFGFSSSETGSTFECRLDGGAWTPCSAPQPYSGLANSVHSFDVRATDSAGNVDPTPASRTWAVNTSGAAVTLEAPADDALTSDSTPPFSGHASIAAGDSDTVNVEIYRPVAGGSDELIQTRSVVRSPTDGSWSVAASPALADGTYLAYATQDDINTVTAYSAPRSFTVDATPPGVTLTGPSTAPGNDRTPTLRGAAGNQSGDSATVTVRLYAGSSVSGSLLQTLPATRSAGSWSIEPASLADGTYTAQAEQTDAAGNTATTAPRSFSIDGTAPNTALSSGPSGTTTATSAAFGFTSPEAGAHFQCRLDAGAWGACTSPKSYSALRVGSHSFAVRALDALGNADTTPATRGWTVAAPAPKPGSVVTPSGSLTLNFTLTARKTQRLRARRPKLTLSATCSAACSLRMSGKVVLSRARAAGLTKRQAAAKRLKLRAKTFTLTAAAKTSVRIALPRKLARQILAGLKQRRRATVTLTGAASSPGASPRTVRAVIRLKR